MTKKPTKMDRRTVLLGMVAGAVSLTHLPSQWVKPVVDMVILPAHAQTSVLPEPQEPPVPDPEEPPLPVLRLSLDCDSITVTPDSVSAPGDYTDSSTSQLFTIAGRVTASPPVANLDLRGIHLTIELGPGDQFTSDDNTGPNNQIRTATYASTPEGQFDRSVVLDTFTQSFSPYCTTLGYRISLTDASYFESQYPQYVVILDDSVCERDSVCGYVSLP